MSLWLLALRNLLRNRTRTVVTILAVATSVLAVVLLRTTVLAWSLGADRAPKDRLLTRNSVAYELGLPRRYVESVRAQPHVKAVGWLNWFGGKDLKHESLGISSYASDPESFLELYDGISIAPEQRKRWLEDRTGALVGSVLAQRMGWKAGDRVTLASAIYSGNWDFTIDAIYTANTPVADAGLFIFHWEYLNQSPASHMHDRVEYVWSRVESSDKSGLVSRAIDRAFENLDVTTRTEDERAFFTSMLGMVSAALRTLDGITVLVLVIMALLLRNTMAMAVDERVSEYATLRAIGFSRGKLLRLVAVESLFLGVSAAALGAALAYPVVELGIGRWIEANMAALIPEFRLQDGVLMGTALVVLLLALLVAAPLALRVTRTDIAGALRRVG